MTLSFVCGSWLFLKMYLTSAMVIIRLTPKVISDNYSLKEHTILFLIPPVPTIVLIHNECENNFVF